MGTCSSSVNHESEALATTDSKTNARFEKLDKADLENKISAIIDIDIASWKLYIKQFNEPISADQLQIWSRQLKLIPTPPKLSNIDNLLRIRDNIYSIEASKYKSYLINFIKALLKKPNQNRVILVDLIYLLKICQDDLLSLYATLQIFYDIGFRTTFDYQQPCLIFNFKDVSHCKCILFWLQLHCKLNLHSNHKVEAENAIIACYKNYETQLILFIAKYCSIYTQTNIAISWDIIRLLSRFVVIDFEMTDSWGNYIKSIFSFHPNANSNILNLNVFDMQRNESFDIEIRDVVKNKNITDIHEMIVLKNQSLPNWIKWHYKNNPIYAMDANMDNNNELTSIYITYNNVARATDYIIFDKYDLRGYRFKKDKNRIMSSYKGIYHPSLHKLICLDAAYLDFGYLYDIDTNQYLQFKLHFKCDVNNDFNACLCDSYSKLFYCSAAKTLIADIDQNMHNEKDIFENISCGAKMLLNRSGHSLLYHDKLAQIIIGGGYEGSDVTNNLLSGRTIEMYDISKDCWNLIDIKTNYIHNNHPSLWYDLFNPFIINMENNDFYSSEFIDIRQQKQWHKNYHRKNFLQQFKNKNTLVFS